MTEHLKFNNPTSRPRILVAPLEWGLGHATRCIPIIQRLLEQQCDVLLAAEGGTFELLQKEFPTLPFLPLVGYRVKYSRKKQLLPFRLFVQLPGIILTIYREHRWLKKVVNEYRIDGVISDNRFGLYHKSIPCIYITHQLLIKTPYRFLEKAFQKLHYSFIKKYSECWIPDAQQHGIAGDLSHPGKLPVHSKYIGPLSRFKILEGTEKKYDLLISISGPEPQRTIFEDMLLKNLEAFEGSVLFVRGLPGEKSFPVVHNSNICMMNHLNTEGLNSALLQSSMIISRCGYTTIMDLIKLGKNAVLVPTPGQTEQEYLAEYMKNRKMFYSVRQEDFKLKDVLEKQASFPFVVLKYNMDEYKMAVDQWVVSLQQALPLNHEV